MSKTAVATKDHEAPAPATSENNSFLGIIERAARDSTVDVGKMRELLAMRKEIAMEEAKQAFNVAMTQAQTEMRPVEADANNSQTRSKYATYHALDKVLRPIYTRHGFALSFNTTDGASENYVRVVCHVSRGSYERTYQIDMPADGKGAKGGDVMTKTHATGSAVTYGMRYLLKMIFNIVIGDDDGNAAGSETITAEQVEWLQSLIVEVGADIQKFCAYLGVKNIEEIPASKYKNAVAALEKKRSAK